MGLWLVSYAGLQSSLWMFLGRLKSPQFQSQSLSWCCQVTNTPDQCSKMYPLATFQPDMASRHQPCHSSISKLCKVVQSRVMGEAVYGAGWSICFRQATVVTSESMRSTLGSTTLWMIELRFSSPPFWGRKYTGVAACLHTWHLFMVTSLVMEKGSPGCSELEFKLWMTRQLRSTVPVSSIAKMVFLGLQEDFLSSAWWQYGILAAADSGSLWYRKHFDRLSM